MSDGSVVRLHRRCQVAEAALHMKVDDFMKRSTPALRNHYWQRNKELEAQLATLMAAAREVVERFKKDEAQGYRSRDRQYAIEMLARLLGDPAQEQP